MAKLCAHCKIAKGAHRWNMSVCADRNRPRVYMLCAGCDAALNEQVLRFMNDPNAARKMEQYRARR